APKLIVAKGRLRSGVAVEIVPRVHGVVAQELEGGAVQLVGAGLGDDVDDGAAVAAVFGGELRLQIEFLNGLNREQRGRRAANAGLVERRIIEERVVVVGAIEGVVVRTVAVAIDGELPESALDGGNARGFDRCPWDESYELAKIAPIQGEVGYEPAVHDFTEHVAAAFHERRFRCDHQLLQYFPHLRQIEICRRVEPDVDLDILRAWRKSRCFGGYCVFAGREFGEYVSTVGTGGGFALQAGADVLRGYFRAGNYAAARIGNGAANRSAKALRPGGRRDQQCYADQDDCQHLIIFPNSVHNGFLVFPVCSRFFKSRLQFLSLAHPYSMPFARNEYRLRRTYIVGRREVGLVEREAGPSPRIDKQ